MRRTPAPAPPRRRDFEQNRARILRAALALAAERGPESLSVSEVAHRAGINRTTAYKHFRTRDALLGAVMESLAETVTDLLSAPMALDERIEQRDVDLLAFAGFRAHVQRREDARHHQQ